MTTGHVKTIKMRVHVAWGYPLTILWGPRGGREGRERRNSLVNLDGLARS